MTVAINILQMLYYDPQYLTPKEGAAGPPSWVFFMSVANHCQRGLILTNSKVGSVSIPVPES